MKRWRIDTPRWRRGLVFLLMFGLLILAAWVPGVLHWHMLNRIGLLLISDGLLIGVVWNDYARSKDPYDHSPIDEKPAQMPKAQPAPQLRTIALTSVQQLFLDVMYSQSPPNEVKSQDAE